MARRPRITEASVAKLGAERLAALLVKEAANNKALKQALQLALESDEGVASLAAGIRQRLVSIGRAQSRLSTNKGREMLAELDRLRASIVSDVGEADPLEALGLLWQLIDLHGPLMARTRDRAGRIPEFIAETVPDLYALAAAAKPAPEQLAEDVYRHYTRNEFGIFDELIIGMAGTLGEEGLDHLRTRIAEALDKHLAQTRRVQSAAAYDHVLETLQAGQREVADAMGDVDGYIATFSAEESRHPIFASHMAVRLVDAKRADEALTVLEHAAPEFDDPPEWQMDWTNARIFALEALGRRDELKALYFETFEMFLSHDHLRGYLKLLPDFDDVEAEEKALAWVSRHPAFLNALLFLVHWPALARAAQMIEQRAREIDGQYYDLLLPAAEALDGKYPLAGILIRRALIAFILKLGRSHRFKQAAQLVNELQSLDGAGPEYGDHENHQAFMERLFLDHPHKAAFWSLLE